MQITSLVENTSLCGLTTAHGLSLYIETKQNKLLFDLGPDETLFLNAKIRGIDLSEIDTVILSHGHYDHGGALRSFLEINNTAKVYIQRGAFLPHFRVMNGEWKYNGIDTELMDHPQVILLDGDHKISDTLSLFTVINGTKCISEANQVLYERNAPDRFTHEQSLLLKEDDHTVLIMGCGHTGIVNILEKAALQHPQICIGGFHLMNPTTGKCVRKELLDEISTVLAQHSDTEFYTCHCTGKEAYTYLSDRLQNMHYFSCGETLTL